MRKYWQLLFLVLVSAPHLATQTGPARAPEKAPAPLITETSSPTAAIEKRIEAYLRNLYAWGPSFRVKIGPLKDAQAPGFYEVSVEITTGDHSDSGVVYVSKDGRFLLRGDMQDMNADPLAVVRSQIKLANNPSRGPANARVNVVEYSDFQCPSCRQLYQTLRAILPNYPHVRFIFKDFPLAQIHPWALTAAIAGRCAFQQNPDAFWKLHDAIFDAQELISANNAWEKMVDFATQAGLDPENFRTCMSGPQARQAVMHNVAEGQALKIANTPTVLVNGRRAIAPDQATLEQYIQYELLPQAVAAPSAPKKPPS